MAFHGREDRTGLIDRPGGKMAATDPLPSPASVNFYSALPMTSFKVLLRSDKRNGFGITPLNP